ncbi:hypothetical protein DL93DRAFT_2169672 [Clavulina sp. PMI_390]|nr:hypothetical protein DL93DRAFT_2169672 [Clavulina sp. PMI_390]
MDSIFTIIFGASEPTPVETVAIEEVELTEEDSSSGNTACVIAIIVDSTTYPSSHNNPLHVLLHNDHHTHIHYTHTTLPTTPNSNVDHQHACFVQQNILILLNSFDRTR